MDRPPENKKHSPHLAGLGGGSVAGAPLPGLTHLASLAGWIADRRGLARLGVAVLAGAAAALSFAPWHFWLLLPVVFTVLVWQLDARARRPLFAAALLGWAFGLGFFGVALYWIGNAFLVDAKTFGALMPAAMLAMNAGLALFPALAFVLARGFWRQGPSRIAIFALAFVAVEWLRGHVLTGFPWALIGYAWGGDLVMMQSVALWGIYGLSLITILAAASPAALISFAGDGALRPIPGGHILPSVSLAIVAALFGFGTLQLAAPPAPSVPNVRLRIVQPSVPQAEKLHAENAGSIFKTHLGLTARPGLDKVTHIIWTEAAVPLLLGDEKDALTLISQTLTANQWLIAGSARREAATAGTTERYYNSLLVISSAGAVVASYDKHHLVPFGEYLPLAPVLARLGLRQMVQAASGFASGPGATTLDVPGAPAIGALICYEAIFPDELIEPGRRPAWLLNITDDTWFGHGVGPAQHFEIARARAVEQGLPLVRAANNGISAVIDPRGRVLGRLGFDVVATLDSDLPQAAAPTLFARIGELAFLGLWLVVASLGFALDRSGKPKLQL
jgi:apolipoprotein N-acyltransferase